MPMYICNCLTGAIDDSVKPALAADITRIHCDVTGAPPEFVHVIFFQEARNPALAGNTIAIAANIRKGRTDDQKTGLVEQLRQSAHAHTGVSLDHIRARTADTPACWVMEGGDIMPEPGEEAAWLAAHGAKLAATAQTR